jgi:hypothetical protein
MIFTKRSEKQSLGKATEVVHKDVYADVEMKVSAKQGPDDPAKQSAWVEYLKEQFKLRGFESRVYYRSAEGGVFSGEISQAMAGATDLIMCQKEVILLDRQPKRWSANINSEIAEKMQALLDNDDLWERGQS